MKCSYSKRGIKRQRDYLCLALLYYTENITYKIHKSEQLWNTNGKGTLDKANLSPSPFNLRKKNSKMAQL